MLQLELINVLDLTSQNIDSIKMELAEKIINKISPLFNEAYINKKIEYKKALKQKKNIIDEVNKKKESMMSLVKEYERKTKIKKLLERINKIVSSDIIHSSLNLKKDMSFLIKIINNLSEEKINHYLVETNRIITKKFSKEQRG